MMNDKKIAPNPWKYLKAYVGLTVSQFKTLYQLNKASYDRLATFYEKIKLDFTPQNDLLATLDPNTLQQLGQLVEQQHQIYRDVHTYIFQASEDEHVFSSSPTLWKALRHYYRQRHKHIHDQQKRKTRPKISKKRLEVCALAKIINIYLKKSTYTKKTIIDVCAGRGYLSVYLALAYPNITFRLYDNDKRAKDRFETLVNILNHSYNAQLSNIQFEVTDISHPLPYVGTIKTEQSLLLALHACGSATDDALTLGIKNKLASLVVPCCHFYRKTIPVHPRVLDILNKRQETVNKVIQRFNFRKLDFKLPDVVYNQHFLLGKFQNLIRVLNYYFSGKRIGMVRFIEQSITPENQLLYYLPNM